MALQLSSLTHQTWCPSTPITSSEPARTARRVEVGWSNSKNSNGVGRNMSRERSVRVRCEVQTSLETVDTTSSESLLGKVTQVDQNTFWPIVNAAQDKTVVLDMYTQWCGPCKVIAPKFAKLAEQYSDVVFLKLDCNQENKALAKELGIRVVPTFKILKESKIVKEITGAKLDDLVAAIDAARSS